MSTIPSNKTVLLRRAAEQDLPWILDQLAAFDKFAAYKRPLMADRAQAEIGVRAMIEKHYFMLAINRVEDPGAPDILLGFMAGYQTPHPFNAQLRVLSETFWWVALEHRRSRAGRELLEAFVDYGSLNFDMVVMTLEHGSPVGEKHLLRRGFVRKETAYLLEV